MTYQRLPHCQCGHQQRDHDHESYDCGRCSCDLYAEQLPPPAAPPLLRLVDEGAPLEMSLPMFAALASVDPIDREILVDHVLVGHSLAHIARGLGISVSRASQRQMRAGWLVRRELMGEMDGNGCVTCGGSTLQQTAGCPTCKDRERQKRKKQREAA